MQNQYSTREFNEERDKPIMQPVCDIWHVFGKEGSVCMYRVPSKDAGASRRNPFLYVFKDGLGNRFVRVGGLQTR
jgi:hypothetical protein